MNLEDIKPGFYVGRSLYLDASVGEVQDQHGELYFSYDDRDDSVLNLLNKGWTFTRLVSVEELSKAYVEGIENGQNAPHDFETDWNNSRAKRVMEGLE
jgi:hypothetical protein